MKIDYDKIKSIISYKIEIEKERDLISSLEKPDEEQIKTNALELKNMEPKLNELLVNIKENENSINDFCSYLLEIEDDAAIKIVRNLIVSKNGKAIFNTNEVDHFKAFKSISEKYDLKEYNIISFDPKGMIYGSKIDETTALLPFKNEKITRLINYLKKDKGLNRELGILLIEILKFNPGYMITDSNEFAKEKESLRKNIVKQIKDDSNLQIIVAQILFNDKDANIFSLFKQLNSSASKIDDLEKEIKSLSDEITRVDEIRKTANERKIELEFEKRKSYDLEDSIRRSERAVSKLQDQVNMEAEKNSMLVFAHKELKERIELENDEIKKKNIELETLYKEMSESYNNLKSNYALKEREVLDYKMELENTKVIVVKENCIKVANNVKEPISTLKRSINAFEKKHPDDTQTIKRLNNVLDKILNGLASSNLTTYGILNEIVEFNTEIHDPEGTVSSGDMVRVLEVGWKYNDEVIVKALVERN